jgi:hypothetical protein
MKNIRFLFWDLALFLSAIVFGLFCYRSMYFLTMGDQNSSLIEAVILSSVLIVFSYGMSMAKRAKGRFGYYIIIEWLLIVFYTGSCLLFFPTFSHYFSVMDQKVTIRQKIVSNISTGQSLYIQYEKEIDKRLLNYENYLQKCASDSTSDSVKFNTVFSSNTDVEQQIKHKIQVARMDFYPSNYKQMKTNFQIYLDQSHKKLDNWSHEVVDIVNSIKSVIDIRIVQVNRLVKVKLYDDDITTSIDVHALQDVTYYFTSNQSITLGGTMLALLLYIVMSFAYFSSSRNSRNDYTLFGKIQRKNSSRIKM